MSENVNILIKAQDLASSSFSNISKNAQKMWSDMAKVSENFVKSNRSLLDSIEKNRDWIIALWWASTIVATWILGIWKMATEQASKMQDLRIELDVLTWSAEKGWKLFQDIIAMWAKTPFESSDLTRATSTMLQFWVAQEDVLKNLDMLWNIAWWNANKLQSISLVFWQIQSAGKLTWWDLLQLVNLWFNPLKTMADRTGESMSDLRDKMSDWQISFEMVKNEMELATSEWGLFFGMMEKKSQTFSWLMSTMTDNLNITLSAIWWFANWELIEWWLLDVLINWMKSLMPLLAWITNRASQNPEMAKNILIFTGAIAWIVAIFSWIALILPTITAWFSLLWSAIVAMTWPIWLTILAIWALFLARQTNFMGIQDLTAQFTEYVSLQWTTFLEMLGITNNQFWNWLTEFFTTRWTLFVWQFVAWWTLISWVFTKTFSALRVLTTWVFKWLYDIVAWFITMVFAFFTWWWREQIEEWFMQMLSWVSWIAKGIFNGVITAIEWLVNSVINALNKLIESANSLPWISIPIIATLSIPRLAKWWIVDWSSFWEIFGAKNFATWWMVSWAKGIDNVPAMLSDGEVVLNKAQQGNLANFIRGGEKTWWYVLNMYNNSFYWDDESFAEKIGDTVISRFMKSTAFEAY